jgi:hypothetical protein
MNYLTRIDISEGHRVLVVNLEVNEHGTKSVLSIYDHGLEPGCEVTLDMLIEDATTEPIEWEWYGEYVGNVDSFAQTFQNNYRKLQIIAELKELLEAEEELAAQLADCRAHIKRVRGEL